MKVTLPDVAYEKILTEVDEGRSDLQLFTSEEPEPKAGVMYLIQKKWDGEGGKRVKRKSLWVNCSSRPQPKKKPSRIRLEYRSPKDVHRLKSEGFDEEVVNSYPNRAFLRMNVISWYKDKGNHNVVKLVHIVKIPSSTLKKQELKKKRMAAEDNPNGSPPDTPAQSLELSPHQSDTIINSPKRIKPDLPPSTPSLTSPLLMSPPMMVLRPNSEIHLVASPTLERMIPVAGSAFGGEVVRLFGKNFLPTSFVIWNGHRIDTIFQSSSEVWCCNPGGSPSAFASLQISNVDTISNTMRFVFQHNAIQPTFVERIGEVGQGLGRLMRLQQEMSAMLTRGNLNSLAANVDHMSNILMTLSKQVTDLQTDGFKEMKFQRPSVHFQDFQLDNLGPMGNHFNLEVLQPQVEPPVVPLPLGILRPDDYRTLLEIQHEFPVLLSDPEISNPGDMYYRPRDQHMLHESSRWKYVENSKKFLPMNSPLISLRLFSPTFSTSTSFSTSTPMLKVMVSLVKDQREVGDLVLMHICACIDSSRPLGPKKEKLSIDFIVNDHHNKDATFNLLSLGNLGNLGNLGHLGNLAGLGSLGSMGNPMPNLPMGNGPTGMLPNIISNIPAFSEKALTLDSDSEGDEDLPDEELRPVGIEEMPEEIIQKILGYLPELEISLKLVCKEWSRILKQNREVLEPVNLVLLEPIPRGLEDNLNFNLKQNFNLSDPNESYHTAKIDSSNVDRQV